MEELKQNEQIQTPKTKKTDEFHLKQITIIALAIFITFCCCILFFFVIYRYNGFTDFWKKLTYILQPVIIGLVVAYLLNPLMKLIDGKLFSLFKGKMKSEKKAKKISRGLAIAGALLFLVGIIVLLIAAIVPSIIQSIQGIISTLPAEVRSLVDWINDIAKGDSQIADIAEEVITQAGNFFENWMKNTLLPQAEVYISSITSGVITGVKFVINILVGLIISVYVMASQEKFAGQAKKIIYAIFKPVRANVVVETVRKSNEIFGGFISGKILDSAIIGVIAYIVLAIMKMPDTMLVAVIIGVTNIIPFFGHFYRGNPILYHYCFAESGTGIILSDFCYYFTAGRRKYYRTEDPRRFHRAFLFLGCICHSRIWRSVGLSWNAAWCADHGSDLLYCFQCCHIFPEKAWDPGNGDRLCQP